MKIDLQKLGSVTVLSPRGAITQDEAERFEQLLEHHRGRTNGRLVLEFSQVPVMDSRAVEVLWDFADRQRAAGLAAKLAAVTELCREIFELTGVAQQLDLYDSSESAVRSFI
jgi:anti-anti-sigma factor